MKILFLTNSLAVGGIEKNIVRLAQELTNSHQVAVASEEGALLPQLLKAGATHLPISFRSRSPSFILRSSRRLGRIIDAEQPDVIHSFSASASVALWLLRHLLRRKIRPVVSSIMGLTNSPDESRFIGWVRAYATTLASDRVIVISPAIGSLVRRMPIRKRRLIEQPVVGVPVPQWRDESEFRDYRSGLRRRLGIPDNEILIMTMGNLEPRKSHELFIRAAAEVLESIANAHFIIVGGGPLERSLQADIDRLAVGSRIRLVGQETEGPALLAACDIYVRPGVVEGFVGITVLEAQAAAVPVIAFETEDVKLAINDGVTGILVSNGDTSALAAAIVALAQGPDVRRRLGLAGLDLVRRSFSITTVAGRLTELYRSLANGPAGQGAR